MYEIWKTIQYTPNYEVSNMGNIKNKKTNKLLTINYERLKKDNKRARPGLSHNGKIKGYYLHRIVAEHFLDNPDNLPEVNHINGDFYNNKVENLEWISKIDNMRHASENKLITRYSRRVIIKNKDTGEEKSFDSVTECAKYLEYSKSSISQSCNNKRIDKIWEMKYEKEERKIEENEDIIWKEYPECPKYLVSNTGEVKNKKNGRLMMGSKVNGYRFVNFHPGAGKGHTPKMNRLIHRMVAQTFLDNPDNKPVVNHKDTNILNNNVDNLEWVTYKENMNTEETIKNLRKGKNSKTIHQILIETGEIVNTFYGAADGQNQTEIDSRTILKICNYYSGNKNYGGDKRAYRTCHKKYIFIFDKDKEKINEFLIEAKVSNKGVNNKLSKKVSQIDKNSGETIKTFNSGYEASKILNISQSGINQCCQYYKYDDENRPKCYKYCKQYKGFIFKQL
tara:strand:- start:161 stop:1510 length:1350 start_codon:yes stop_codon:yes gene_type:complete